MKDGLQIKKSVEGKVTILHLTGALDAVGEEAVLAFARDVYDAGSRLLIFDLAEVSILTSAGMRALHKVFKIFTPLADMYKVSYIRLCRVPQALNQSLGMTGFLQNIPSYETIQEALDSFS
jgi:anti-anti-sigma factor